ncbi:MAG: ShlB/FhaC/HecB family hemolysin secretion/activation protein [Rhodoferax sp.]|nr:ShlB/FhaC/HecB family hemolysin secretion/activation protein [Rhodoferax sp.]
MRSPGIWMLALLAGFGVSPQLSAQPAPGRVEQEIRPMPEPTRRDSVRIPQPSFAEQVPQGADTVRFTLGEVVLSGNRTLSREELQPIWAEMLGKPVTLKQAFGIAAGITARYRAAGYVLSQAIVPAQNISTSGAVAFRIDVLEGFVERVTFSGFTSPLLAEYLAPVTNERPLRLATLERALLLVNELAGLRAQANLKAGATPGSSELELVAQQAPRSLSLLAHNRTTPSQGDVRVEAGADVKGLLGDFDRHNLRLVTSGDKRLNLIAYSGEAPVGASGLKALWSASTSRSEPDVDLPNVDTESTNASLGLAYPVYRSRESSLSVRTTFTGYNNSSGGGSTSRDRIRAVRLGLTGDYADTVGGISLIDIEVSKGLSGLGASSSDDPLLNGAQPDFTKATVYAARLQSLGGDWSVLLAATAQSSGDKLPTAEQLGLGGEVFLRAFDPSEVIGENGYAGKVELRYNLALGSAALTLYAYGDVGSVKRKQVGASDLEESLAAYGLGLRFSGPAGVRGYLEVAKPAKKDVASQGDRDPRGFAGLGFEF